VEAGDPAQGCASRLNNRGEPVLGLAADGGQRAPVAVDGDDIAFGGDENDGADEAHAPAVAAVRGGNVATAEEEEADAGAMGEVAMREHVFYGVGHDIAPGGAPAGVEGIGGGGRLNGCEVCQGCDGNQGHRLPFLSIL